MTSVDVIVVIALWLVIAVVWAAVDLMVAHGLCTCCKASEGTTASPNPAAIGAASADPEDDPSRPLTPTKGGTAGAGTQGVAKAPPQQDAGQTPKQLVCCGRFGGCGPCGEYPALQLLIHLILSFPIGFLLSAGILAAYIGASATSVRFPAVPDTDCKSSCEPGGDQYCCSYNIASGRFGLNNFTGQANPADAWFSSEYAGDAYGPGGSMLVDPTDGETDLPGGTKLHGWYFQNATDPAWGVPGCSEPTPWLTILYAHGSGWNVGVEYRKSRYEWLLSLGKVRFLAYDYPGYGKSDGSPSPETIYESSLAALRWLEAQASLEGSPGVEPRGAGNRIVLIGRSLGGNQATRLAAETVPRTAGDAEALESLGGKARAVLLWSTFTSWVDTATYLYPMLGWAMGGVLQPAEGYRTVDQIKPYGKGSGDPAIAPPPACLYQSHSPDDEWVRIRDAERVFEEAKNVPTEQLPPAGGSVCPGRPAEPVDCKQFVKLPAGTKHDDQLTEEEKPLVRAWLEAQRSR